MVAPGRSNHATAEALLLPNLGCECRFACAVLLVVQVVFPSTYEGQVAIATAQLLAAMAHQQLTADEGC